jgi:SNF2 family DNA or RNA helicase
VRGGILADEMGMGKTIQAVATILYNRPLQPHTSGFEQQDALWRESDMSHCHFNVEALAEMKAKTAMERCVHTLYHETCTV